MKNAFVRRQLLRERMDALAGDFKTCASCSGLCCTYQKNSMQTTHEETLDLYQYLVESGRWNEELETKLKSCVSDYRLDKNFDSGRRSLRKTYTCPFYTPGPTGCSIPRSVKPYGCLAFNPTRPNASAGEGCESDQELLRAREEQGGLNNKIFTELWWEKLPMPWALLEFRDYLQRQETKS